jgi:hypothetical protein
METYWNAGQLEVFEDGGKLYNEACRTINSSLN